MGLTAGNKYVMTTSDNGLREIPIHSGFFEHLTKQIIPIHAYIIDHGL